MGLFQKSVLRKHINELDKEAVAAAYKKLKAHFGDAAIQQNIRDAKEEEYQEGFVRDLFVKVLGYTLKPQPDYNFVLEKKNEKDSKKSDGAILTATGSVLAAVELKGTDTVDLDHVEEQAFGYKNNQKGCRYVVVSNFEKLRFYVEDSVEHLEWDLFTLSADDFAVLYLCLEQGNLLKNLPAAIKEASVNEEQGITKKLYKDYSTFKRLLYQNICEQNPAFDKLVVYKKTQKLLDRFLFILFAEDKQLLPPNSIREILMQWQMLKENDAYFPLYARYQKYFGYMNTGHKGKQHDIFAYNGGLFAADEVLDTITIDDRLLYDSTYALSQYDFETEVDVNILGHIFEHSLNDVDAVAAESEGKQLEKEKTRRKKDGVFYTPKYITKYIVENTVGKLCAEKKTELEIKDEDYSGGKKKKDKKALNEKLESYTKWLLELTILDPACGSGAFLNQALEFLIAEHRKVDELRSKLFEDSLVLSDVENHILENNLFGVDLNEESIEIAKLSLWLRTAKKGRKLSSLNSNIKCGNSLIDDRAVAGDKAFVWEEEFKEVFKEKEKFAFHITTATHDSRTSERMIVHKVREKRDNGTRPNAAPIWLKEKDEILITETVARIVEEDKLNVLAYNICGDHMHLLLVCEEEEVPKIMQKIKSVTAKEYNRATGKTVTREHAPLSECESGIDTTRQHAALSNTEKEPHVSLWTQKFGCKQIMDDEQMANTIAYIQGNRIKHELPVLNKGACSLVESMCCDLDYAFRTEYKGGFDVVVGNPPYVRAETIDKREREYYLSKESKYKRTFGRFDLYILFNELGISLLKERGFLSYIFPSSFYNQNYSVKQREWLLNELDILELIDLSNIDVFKGVAVETGIITVRKALPSKNVLIYKPLNEVQFLSTTRYLISKDIYRDLPNTTFRTDLNEALVKLIKKITEQSKKVNDFCYVVIGAVPHNSETGASKDRLIKNEKENERCHKYIEGKNVNRYLIEWDNKYLDYQPDEMHRPKFPELFENEKLLVRNISTTEGLMAAYDYEEYYVNDTMSVVIPWWKLKDVKQRGVEGTFEQVKLSEETSVKYILALINSRLLNFYFKLILSSNLHVYPEAIRNLPIKIANAGVQTAFIEAVNTIVNATPKLQVIQSQFLAVLQSKVAFSATREHAPLPKKLQGWYELEFKEFVKELEKATRQRAALSLRETAEWMPFFAEQKKKAMELKNEIEKTDKEIDRMVYVLYGLTEEEVKIVEGNTPNPLKGA